MPRLVPLLLGAAVGALFGCAPKARPLPGAPAPAHLPTARLPDENRRVDFRWEFREGELAARGEGVARLAPPDSARLDFFIDGGLGGGWALLVGDSIVAPGGDELRRLLPPPSMLWAALGRLAVPPAADTTARREGDRLRADIGRDPVWRVTFDGDRLVGLERISRDRVVDQVTRTEREVRYDNGGEYRSLVLKVTRNEKVPEHDPSIWRP